MRITERAFKWHINWGNRLFKQGKINLARWQWGKAGYIRRELDKKIKVPLRKKCKFIAKFSYKKVSKESREKRHRFLSEWSGEIVTEVGTKDSDLESSLSNAVRTSKHYEAWVADKYDKFEVVLRDCVPTTESYGVKSLKVDWFERL